MMNELDKAIKNLGISIHNHAKPLYRYTDVLGAMAMLKNCSILLRTPNSFNDPYDFNTYSYDFSYNGMFDEEFKRTVDKVNEQSIRQIGKPVYSDYNVVSQTNFEALGIKAVEQMRSRCLVFCTSEVKDNILMWSHYANKHSGICVGIKLLPEMDFDKPIKLITLRVCYQDKIKSYKFYSEDDDLLAQIESTLNLVYIKSQIWSYEMEVRSVVLNVEDNMDLSNGYQFQLSKENFVEIIFGVNTSESDINNIIALSKDIGYKLAFSKMELDRTNFLLKASPL